MELSEYNKIVFFTGAGMSAESGVPTYRGQGGIWSEYKWQEYACEEAFRNNPSMVLDFHEQRRIEALKCDPHLGHHLIKKIQATHPKTKIVTQNIDGMHQRALSPSVIELHGSLWKMRCIKDSMVYEDLQDGRYETRYCSCGNLLRPDIIWFQDMLDEITVQNATEAIRECDLFISIGTSAVVWPAAGFPKLAKTSGAYCIEINPETTELTSLYDESIREKAGKGLDLLVNDRKLGKNTA